MKVWLSKYALTRGIKEVEAKRCSDVDNDMIEIIGVPYADYYHGEGKEWHLTKESAIKKAEEMRINKIESLKKRIKKIENIKFE